MEKRMRECLTQEDENIPISRSSHYISLSEIYESSAR